MISLDGCAVVLPGVEHTYARLRVAEELAHIVNSVELCARPTQLECLIIPSIHVDFLLTWAPAELVV